MTTWVKQSLLAALLASVGAAAPLCVQGTYTSYRALGAGGCSIGAETFSAFSTLAFSNSLGVPTLSADQILISPSVSGDTDSLAFTYQTAASGAPVTVSLNQMGQAFAFSFSYLATAAPSSVLSSVQMASTFSNTNPGSVSASKNIELETGGPIFTSAMTDGGVSHPLATYNGPVTPVSGSGTFIVNDAISLQAQAGAVSDSGFTNTFNLGVSSITATPEPAASLLIGSGLLLFGALMRRIANRRAERRS
jgi:hypothetical protein